MSGASSTTIPGATPKPRPSAAANGSSSTRPRSGSRVTPKNTSDPVLRNALRYTISASEYSALHKYILSKSKVVKRNVPTVATVERILDGADSRTSSTSRGIKEKGGAKSSEASCFVNNDGADTYNARAIRESIRVFIGTGAVLKLLNTVQAQISQGKKGIPRKGEPKQPFYKSETLRLSLSLSTILLLYRLLFRFFTRLRGELMLPGAIHFRERNPRIAQSLTSPYAPAVGASLAGLAMGIYPSKQLRVTMTIAMIFKALEFGWNTLEDDGSIWGWKKVRGVVVQRERPWWFGSWLLQPFAFGQLLHAIVFDRDCFPKAYGDWIFKFSGTYLDPPSSLIGPPTEVKWLSPYDIVDRLANMAKMCWPPNEPASLFPGKETLPSALQSITPLVAPTHPAIKSMACATLHPTDPSCLRTNLLFWVQSFPPIARIMLMAYTALLIPKYKKLYHAPVATLRTLLALVLRMSTFVTGSVGTAWASICFFQHTLSRRFLPTQRFFLGGFIAGLWAWIERRSGRNAFLYSARLSVDSLWKVGVKRRWWRAMKGGDVWLFAMAMLVTGVVYEKDKKAMREGYLRKGMSWVKGTGWKDWAIEESSDDDDEDEEYSMEDETQIMM